MTFTSEAFVRLLPVKKPILILLVGSAGRNWSKLQRTPKCHSYKAQTVAPAPG